MIDTAFLMIQLLSTVLKQGQFQELELEVVPSIKVLDIVKCPQVQKMQKHMNGTVNQS